MQVVTLKVPEMFCPGCEIGVKIAANKVDGVKEVKTDSDTRTASITFDPSKTTPQAIASAITKGLDSKSKWPTAARRSRSVADCGAVMAGGQGGYVSPPIDPPG